MHWSPLSSFRFTFLAVLIAAVGTLVSLDLAYRQHTRIELKKQGEFELGTDHVQAEVGRRFAQPIYGLGGAAGMYAASQRVDRAAFRAYVETRDLPQEFPGVRGFGFIAQVPKADEAAFVARARADGAPAFSIRELAPSNHADRYVIKYIEPLALNAPALGLDVGSEANRRRAIERAIDSGEPTLTDPIVLVQDGRQSPGFLLYVPVYRYGSAPLTGEQRRAALVGVLYSPIVAAEILSDVAASERGRIDLELFAVTSAASEQTLVYDTLGRLTSGAGGTGPEPQKGRPLTAEQTVQILDRPFLLRTRSTPAFDASFDGSETWLTLAAGLALTTVLAYLAHVTASARRRAEALAQQMTLDLDRLATVARRTSNAVVITDLQRRITWVNEGFERTTGYRLEEVRGQSPGRLLQCEDTDPAEVERLRSALNQGQEFRGELKNRHKDGRAYWLEIEIQPLRDASGELTGFMAIETDITERRQAVEALALERERLSLIVEGTSAGTWEVNLQTGEDQVNPIYAAMLGLSVPALRARMGASFLTLVHPEDRDAITRARQAHIDGLSEQYVVEFRMQHADGHWLWILSRGRVGSRDDQGRPLMMSGIHLDITERKQAERSLSRERLRLTNIIEGTNVGTWEWNVENGETRFDERWAGIAGYTLEELGQTSIQTWSDLCHPDDLARSSVLLQRHFDNELPHYECEARMRHKDGHWIWVLDRGRLFSRADDGRPRWMAGTHMDITHRKLAESALRESQAFLSRVGTIAGIGGWTYELGTGLLTWSDQTCAIFEVEAGASPTLKQALGFFAQDARRSGRQALRAAIAQHAGFDFELPLVTTSGRALWVRVVGEVESLDGRASRLVGTIQDVTQRHHMEQELRRNSEVMTSIVENLPCGLSVFDADLRLVASNRKYRELLDFPDHLFAEPHPPFESFIRFNAERGEYGPGDVETLVRQIVERARGPTVAHVFERERPNGVPVEVQGAPMPTGGFVTTYADISERKRAEREIQRSGTLLRGAIEAIDEAFVLYDPDDRLVLCNDRYRAIYEGVADLIVPGVRFEDLVRAGAQRGDYLAAVGRVEDFVRERVAAHLQANSTIVQRLENGRTLRIVERKLPDGHIVGFRIDVTELMEATEAAEAASKAKSQFLANMSHEIRTPMNAILGMLALLRRTELTPRQADYAAKTEGAARSLLGLLNDILDFSKVEAGKMALDPHPFRVDQMLRDLAVILSSSAGGKPIEVLFDIDPAVPGGLVGDAMRLKQVLINLGGNAIKFTEHGEVVLSMAVTARSATEVTLAVAVRDTGIGIAPENQARIFSGFTQAEASTTRRFGGTGLGVAISQRLVALMGGELKLDSAVGRGSRFFFEVTLPIHQTADADRPALPPPPPASGMSVLIVDDNPTARDALEVMAGSLGWAVTVADSGEQALAMLQDQPGGYDAVFIDWQMPGLDGWQTCDRIRQQSLAGQAPVVVMLTAHGREMLEQRSEEEQRHLDGFLVKPVTASMLYDAIVEARQGGTAAPPRRPTPGKAERRLAGLRLLVVEDNANNQQVARELLEDEGAEVQIAGNGQLGVEAVAAAEPAFDVVLMDLQMPVMDGYTATSRIRQDLGRLDLPIVAMTANALSSDREACLAAGMNEHVGKPFDLDHLVQVLRRLSQRGEVAAPVRATAQALNSDLLQAGAAAGVDIGAAVARLGGKLGTYRRLLHGFVRDLAAMPGQLRSQADRGQWAEASRQMHTVKGLAATLGAGPLSSQAAEAERLFRQDPGSGEAQRGLQAIEAAITRALPELDTLCGQLDRAAETPGDASTSSAAVDKAALTDMLQTLARLLADSDMDALNLMDRLRGTPAGALSAGVEALDDAVVTLDFDRARQACEALIEEIRT